MTDTKRELMVKMTMDGESVLTIETPELPSVYDSERKFIPTDVCVAPNGDIYVTDGYGQHWIHQYDAKGVPIRSWGGKGSEPGQMICPHGICVDSQHNVYVAEWTQFGRITKLARK
ncbi:hypothetical protein [Paenibacillus sp. Soil787]|uniref:hypothetical protein n=1 Tax=Paenibacillus sp. Soil787 TaxID=1736411 RepID=UPI00138F69CD|nr:hypothetical protein [Paenibacillus sp. Soil787]